MFMMDSMTCYTEHSLVHESEKKIYLNLHVGLVCMPDSFDKAMISRYSVNMLRIRSSDD